MAYKIKYIILIFLLGLSLASCLKKAELSGFVYSAYKADERFAQSDSWNKTHAQKKRSAYSSSYTFYVAGDIHIGEFQNYTKMLNAIDTGSFYCVAGDITTGNSEDYDRLDTFLIFHEKTMHYFTNGNHDLYFEGWKKYYSMFGASTYTLEVNSPDSSDLFIFLDSGNGTLGEKQMSWLENVLTTRSSFRHCFVFTHTNFFMEHNTTSTNPLPEEVYHLLDLFTKNKVDIVFMGHDHRQVVEHFGPTTYITLDALKDGHKDASYLECTVDGASVSYRFIKVN